MMETEFKKVCSRKKKNNEESCLVRACIELLVLKGYFPIRNNSGMLVIKEKDRTRAVKMGMKGSADIIACSPEGKFVAIECKTSRGRLSKAQQEFLNKVQSIGGIALVIRNIDDLIKFLEGKGRDEI
ncbi:VRR-NUC domain-containing protein [Thermodesulfovibrio yellowstonii]|uniref:VRR-NUC domain-containing protein n=1 Tax=Thermodesulfovibrio yellowstonii TaxID=28262 RepID=UPI00146FBAF0|nr:VRR-NUC domain-containing protein [Thermodesulfovibrio islandicus]